MPTEDPRPDNADGSSYDDVGSVVMGDSEGSYVYVDDEGKVVPPEEETSWLMAMGVGGHGQASNVSAVSLASRSVHTHLRAPRSLSEGALRLSRSLMR